MPETPQDIAQNRACSTDEERKVLALEKIADQMEWIANALKPISVSASSPDTQAGNGARHATDAWKNEGGNISTGAVDSFGISHTVIDQFEIGGYHYTKLADAISEAKRAKARS